MKEVVIDFDNKSPADLNKNVNIAAFLTENDDVEYKFIEGLEGVWKTIKDFSSENICNWKPSKPGKYMIMVQGKSSKSKKSYDYLGKSEYEVIDNKKLIREVEVSRNKINVGDKTTISVGCDEELVLYRFWINGENDWEILRDYSTEDKFTFTGIKAGSFEILVECKRINSKKNVDDFTTIKIEVVELEKIEITDFECLTNNKLVNEELAFKVKVNYQENRPLLYKFLKVNKEGKVICIQDFSSRSIVTFKEKVPGEYKLLCLVRDMFSSKPYDDRAIILYNVDPYKEVKIKSFKSDIKSPQAVGTVINLIADVSGGRELLYRYIIEGPVCDDSGYIRSNSYLWTPEEEGEYTITLKVKDISYKGDYEDIAKISYIINARGERPVRIIDLKCDGGKYVLKNNPVNIRCKACGGSKILYQFRIFKDGKLRESIEYDKGNWLSFIPDECGEYEIEVKAKDFYSAKEYDSSISTVIKVQDFIPAEIKYVLSNSKEIYIVNETIDIEVIMENTNNSLVRFVTSINGQEVEDTGYVESKLLRLKPRCQGKYNVNIFAKNAKSSKEYDSRELFSIYVHEVIPVNGTKVFASSDEIKVGRDITFEAESQGGKDVCYEFYMMNKGNWILVQEYSKKKYYSFIPFVSGKYKILVLSKSFYKKVNYEDYDIMEFNVEE